MVRIAITQAAFDAIAKTLPLGSVGYDHERTETDRPQTSCSPSGGAARTFSDVILRLTRTGRATAAANDYA
jgi:hypothetical protein